MHATCISSVSLQSQAIGVEGLAGWTSRMLYGELRLHFMRWRPRSPKDLYEALPADMSTGHRRNTSAGSVKLEDIDEPVAQASAAVVTSEKIELNTPLAGEVRTKHSPAVSIAQLSPGTDKQHDISNSDQQPANPQGWQLLAIIAALCLAVFLVALDQTIVSTAIPRITDHFHSVDDIGW
jgi:hypothetical protein